MAFYVGFATSVIPRGISAAAGNKCPTALALSGSCKSTYYIIISFKLTLRSLSKAFVFQLFMYVRIREREFPSTGLFFKCLPWPGQDQGWGWEPKQPWTPTWWTETRRPEPHSLPPQVCIRKKLDSGAGARNQTHVPWWPKGCSLRVLCARQKNGQQCVACCCQDPCSYNDNLCNCITVTLQGGETHGGRSLQVVPRA